MGSDWDVSRGISLLIERQLMEGLLSDKYAGTVDLSNSEVLAREVENLRFRVISLEIRVLELYKILKRMQKELKDLKKQALQCEGSGQSPVGRF